MQKKYLITLHAHDLGQLVDGIRCRAETWEATAEYLEKGCIADESFVCEECSSPREAKAIARQYRRILRQIEQQVQQQGGWS